MLAQAPGSILWVTLAEFTLSERETVKGSYQASPRLPLAEPVPAFPRCCTVPPGDVLPLPIPEFAAIQNRTLLERERCGVCGDRGVCWHGQCWLCSGCAECDDFCDDKMCWN